MDTALIGNYSGGKHRNHVGKNDCIIATRRVDNFKKFAGGLGARITLRGRCAIYFFIRDNPIVSALGDEAAPLRSNPAPARRGVYDIRVSGFVGAE